MDLNKIKRFLITFFATAAGSGLTPKAPGTAGTVVGLLLVYGLQSLSFTTRFVLFVLLFIVGWWASLEWSKIKNQKDAQTIVIDEVLGYWLTLILLEFFWGEVFTFNVRLTFAFFAFRLFDILKPPPIRQLDRWGKHFEIGPLQSLGVIVDDLLAGVYAAGLMAIVHYWITK